MSRFPLVLILIIATGIGVWYLARDNPNALDEDGTMRLVYYASFGALVASGVVMSYRGRFFVALRHAAIWVALFAGAILLYSFRSDFTAAYQRIRAELVPGAPMPTEAGAMEIRRGGDGHFTIIAQLNGVSIPLLVDTGASTLSLSRWDAERAGIDTDALSYTMQLHTANGIANGALTRVREIRIGAIVRRDVEAVVMQGNPGGSMLGMNVLDTLSGYAISGDTLTLTD